MYSSGNPHAVWGQRTAGHSSNPPPPQAPKLVAEDLHLSHTSCRHTLGISPLLAFLCMYIHTIEGRDISWLHTYLVLIVDEA